MMSESAEARQRRENPAINKSRDRQKNLRKMNGKEIKKKARSKDAIIDLRMLEGMSVDEALETVKE